METKVCTICTLPLENEDNSIVTVKQDGLKTLIKMSIAKNDDKHLAWKGKQSFQFHEVCRKRYQVPPEKSKFSRTSKSSEEPSPSTSTNKNNFNFTENCFFCGNSWYSQENRSKVTQNYETERILTTANLRKDKIGHKIINRLHGIKSLVTVKARYHDKCWDKFFILPDKDPEINENTQEVQKIVDSICKFIEESKDTKFQLSTLQKIMGNNGLSDKQLFRELKKRYGNDIFISQGPRNPEKETIIYYKDESARSRANSFQDPEEFDDAQKKMILQTAAEILRQEILEKNYENPSRKSSNLMDSVKEDVPDLLSKFLSTLTLSKKQDTSSNSAKLDNLAHVIISGIQPKSFNSQLHHAVGAFLYKQTGDKSIIDVLSRVGVSPSFQQLKSSGETTDPGEMPIDEDVLLQYVFGNTGEEAKDSDCKRTADSPGNEETLEVPLKKCKTSEESE